MESNNKLTSKDYANAVIRSYVLQNAQNYGTMQGTGMLNSIWPQLRKIYKDDEEEFKRIAIANLDFYNTNPQPYPFVATMMLSMYDNGAKEEDTNAMKMALMGPLAGIGDALSQFGVAPLFSTVFATLILHQHLLISPLLFFLCCFGVTFSVRCLMGYLGFKFGTSIIESLSTKMAAIAEIASTIGLTVIAGLSLKFVKMNLGFKYATEIDGKQQLVSVQTILDQILPFMLPMLLTFGVYKLITKYNWKIQKILLLLVVIGFALSFLGILVP